jgi:TetR/AcrR family transcriptional regulator, cholesterol catabolism regulator
LETIFVLIVSAISLRQIKKPNFTLGLDKIMKDQILLKATDLFLTLGFKSVTMDDIATEIGISKKTIYQHFSNKYQLVEASTMHLFETISCGIDEICALENNPLEELFLIKDFVMKNLKNESASPIHQLQKYYPKIHKTLMMRQFEKMGDCVIVNLEKGIRQGLFRNEINTALIARFYFAGMTSLKDTEIFHPEKFPSLSTQMIYLEYHLRGICTEKGIQKLEQLLQ